MVASIWVVVIDLDLNWMEGLFTLIWLRVFVVGVRQWWLEDDDGGARAVLVLDWL